MRWPFVESELENQNVVGWLMPALTLAACYYVGDTLLASVFLISGVAATILLLNLVPRRPWQQWVILLWAIAPIGFVIVELRTGMRAYSR